MKKDQMAELSAPYRQYVRRKWGFVAICAAVMALACLASLAAGSAGLSLGQILGALVGYGSRETLTIIWNVRMPRIAAAVVVGAALAMSGCVMQNVLRNPLASASTLGVSQGASFGAAVAIICLGAGSQINSGGSSAALTISNPYLVTACAFLGGMATTVLILALSRVRGVTPSTMVLAGVAISSMFTGGTTLVQYFADDVMVATVVQINFRYAGQALEGLGIEKINGALLDLGVSSHQLDDAARGFSYRADAPLDMRMSQQGETAADLVNTASREELARILRDYGEEPYAWQIAGHIVEVRETAPIETTLQLADIVASAMPPAERRKNKNPSRRTFQALRIAVNHELDALEEGLDTIFDHLAPGGRLCVITFHSLEDRLVKNKFRRWSTACTCPPEFPVCVCGGKAKAKLITRKPIEADQQELEENRRSRSAHLRVLEKL